MLKINDDIFNIRILKQQKTAQGCRGVERIIYFTKIRTNITASLFTALFNETISQLSRSHNYIYIDHIDVVYYIRKML